MKSFHSYALRAREAAQQAVRDAEARAIRSATSFDARAKRSVVVTPPRAEVPAPRSSLKRLAPAPAPAVHQEPDEFLMSIALRLQN